MIIKKIKEKLPLAVMIFILAQPLIDVLTTVSTISNLSVSVGLLIRGLFMAAAFVYLFTQKKWRLPTIVLAAFLAIYCIFNAITGGLNVAGLTMLMKVFYLPVAIMFFYQFKNKLFSDKIYFYLLIVYLILLIIPSVLGLSLIDPTNYDEKVWFRGLFFAGNDIAAVLICLSPPALWHLIKNKSWVLLSITSFLLITATILIGTKAMIICLIATAVFLLIQIGKKWRPKTKIIVTSTSLIAMVGGALLLPLTPVYKNTMIALEYHGVNSIADIARPEIIDKVVLSERPTFFLHRAETFKVASWDQKILGLYQNTDDKIVESDPYDIFFSVGILGTAIYILLIVYFCCFVDWRLIAKPQKFSSILMLLIALFVGHVLITPAVATIFALNFIKKVPNDNHR